ncbi:hypothetical protein [Parahaliea aestuarii]|uniref:Uncharacterized protein n=1 Tax=Parahaliea aestuarii TaxID=1852021 RepID=A0A5C8ZLI7_9GAMM|nr:hypothetical protein [Parahaliea aestuarii]TXS89333.1 hypothetical protein FVW59_17600 [Parahaliea aestuarii]
MRPVLVIAIAAIGLLIWQAAGTGVWRSPGKAASEHHFSAADLKASVGNLQALGSDSYRITLASNGFAVIELRTRSIQIGQFARFAFHLQADAGLQSVDFVWRTYSRQIGMQKLPSTSGQASVNLQALADLPPSLGAVALRLQGQPGSAVELSGLTLEPPTFGGPLLAAIEDWLQPGNWNRASINAHLGVNNAGSAIWPVPFTAWLCAFLIAVVAVFYGLARLGPQRALGVTSAVFVGAWLLLDGLWIRQLLHRSDAATEQFHGQPEYARRVAIGDRAMAELSARAQALIGVSGERIFVSSAGDYQGMRTAWYLYPHNVYWLRDGPELPERQYLQQGDLVAVMRPTTLRYLPEKQQLLWPGHYQLHAVELARTAAGALYRLQ